LIRTWRIVHQRNAETAFSGEGSRKRGGRWNGRGYRAVYVADSLALATLEILVHGVPYEALNRFVCIPALIPEELITDIKIEELPPGWRNDPPLQQLQDIGNKWVGDNRYAVLKVPSAVIPTEFNYVINPTHTAFKQIIIGTAEHHTGCVSGARNIRGRAKSIYLPAANGRSHLQAQLCATKP
jgi:RES domain-containing protein